MKRERGYRMTPAAMGAALSGDLENFVAASTPGGIEAQEARGQREAVAAQRLPLKGTTPREPWEKLGFVFGDAYDDQFVNVTFPKGWTLSATGHSVWSDLLDDKGRRRAGMFYKAAFYDRSANISMSRRFAVDSYHKDGVCVTDCGAVVKCFGKFASRDYDHQDKLDAQARAWLAEKYPQWEDAAAYWD